MRQLLLLMIHLVHLLVIWIGLVLGWLFLFGLVCSQNTDPYQHLGCHNPRHFGCLQFGNAKIIIWNDPLQRCTAVEVSKTPFDIFRCIPMGFKNKPEDGMMCWTMYSSVFLLVGFGFGRTMTHRLMGIILLPNRVVHRPRCVRTCPFACFDWSTGDCVQSDFE